MKENYFFNFKKLELGDFITIIVYLLFSIYITDISFNLKSDYKNIISIYSFCTPLFLYLFNYKSLRNFNLFLIWFLFSLFHLWLYHKIKNINEFNFVNGHASDGLNYISIFLIYFQVARYFHLKLKGFELVAPKNWLYGNKDIFDERKIKFWDVFLFLLFFISWLTIFLA